tara:strand:- start:23510 stop:24226 length:717 start_codon:yes stop_codon:yes gene_type:complete
VCSIPEDTRVSKAFVFDLNVLFEDDYLALVHKPAGILVSGNTFKTVANALSQNLKRSTQVDVTSPKPVHRLDYATTGVLMVGKTSSSIRALNQSFEAKQITKTYFAVTIGRMPSNGCINEPIDDKASETNYTVIATVPSPRFGCLNLVQLHPKTGRRHQLRKHLSGIGHPILGDKDYGITGLILNGKGLYLHAHTLKFTHPSTNEVLTIIDGLPKRFVKLFLINAIGYKKDKTIRGKL